MLEALEHGVDLKAAIDGVDLGSNRGKAADRRVDIGARGVAGDAGHAVGEGRRDDDAMRHRFGRDGRDGAGEGFGVDLGRHLILLAVDLGGQCLGAGEADLEDAPELVERGGCKRRRPNAARDDEVDGRAGALLVVQTISCTKMDVKRRLMYSSRLVSDLLPELFRDILPTAIPRIHRKWWL